VFGPCQFRKGGLPIVLCVSLPRPFLTTGKSRNGADSGSIESTFENSNHHIHSSDDTINHPEFSFTHMREYVLGPDPYPLSPH
jgi:hypothetical protein